MNWKLAICLFLIKVVPFYPILIPDAGPTAAAPPIGLDCCNCRCPPFIHSRHHPSIHSPFILFFWDKYFYFLNSSPLIDCYLIILSINCLMVFDWKTPCFLFRIKFKHWNIFIFTQQNILGNQWVPHKIITINSKSIIQIILI